MSYKVHEVLDTIAIFLNGKGFTCLFYLNRFGISHNPEDMINQMYVSCANGHDFGAEYIIAAGTNGIRMAPIYNGRILEIPTGPYDPCTNIGCVDYNDPDMMNKVLDGVYAILGQPTIVSRIIRGIHYCYNTVSGYWNKFKERFKR